MLCMDQQGVGPVGKSEVDGGGAEAGRNQLLARRSAGSTLGQDDTVALGDPDGQSEPASPLHIFRWLRQNVPRGNNLDPATFGQRHRLLMVLLALHLPALYGFGLWQDFEPVLLGLELAPAAVALLMARLIRPGRLAAFFVTAGLVYCSAVLVHLSGGVIEAHFHFFILIGFIALYQDWVPFLWNVAFVVLSHGLGSSMAADAMFNHHAAQHNPWIWAAIHGVAVLAACIGVIIFWRHVEKAQQGADRLRRQLAWTELAGRESLSRLLVHLARRNQVLLERQIGLLVSPEPEPTQMFQLIHLSTRMRRNAESLLVLSGDESPRQWREPVALVDVARSATAEVEAHHRVMLAVTPRLSVAGSAATDLVHLLAELIENAIAFSPPHTQVDVQEHLLTTSDGHHIVTIRDDGMGLPTASLDAANEILSNPPDIDPELRCLGLHVVGRLARRHRLAVKLSHSPGSGVTAAVYIPSSLLEEVTSSGSSPAYATRDPDSAARLVLGS